MSTDTKQPAESEKAKRKTGIGFDISLPLGLALGLSVGLVLGNDSWVIWMVIISPICILLGVIYDAVNKKKASSEA